METKRLELTVSTPSDFVHDITFNYFGDRLALCTASQKISIWDKDDDDWKESAVIEQAHSGPIWRLDWAHPEFGAVLVSCSEDRGVFVWTEKCGGPYESRDKTQRWRKRAQLLDATAPTVCVQFAPKQHGLKLAAASLDGVVRCYEAPDALNMGCFEMEDINVSSKQGKYSGCQSLAWGPWRKGGQYLAVLGIDSQLSIFHKQSRRWMQLCRNVQHSTIAGNAKDVAFAPHLCRPYDIVVTCGNPDAILWRFDVGTSKGVPQLQKIRSLECKDSDNSMVWRVAWNITGTMLTLSPENGQLSVWTTDSRGEWQNVCRVQDAD